MYVSVHVKWLDIDPQVFMLNLKSTNNYWRKDGKQDEIKRWDL